MHYVSSSSTVRNVVVFASNTTQMGKSLRFSHPIFLVLVRAIKMWANWWEWDRFERFRLVKPCARMGVRKVNLVFMKSIVLRDAYIVQGWVAHLGLYYTGFVSLMNSRGVTSCGVRLALEIVWSRDMWFLMGWSYTAICVGSRSNGVWEMKPVPHFQVKMM